MAERALPPYICPMTLAFRLASRFALSLSAAVTFAGPSAATDTLEQYVATYGPRLEICIFDSDPGTMADCKGALSQICSQTEAGGDTTLGMVDCMAAETRVWDDYLNREYQATLAWAAEMDALEGVADTGFPSLRDALRSAQRIWIDFRDAECLVDYAVWGRGSMRTIAGASCQMEMTADRTIHLRSLRERTQ